MHIPGFTPNQNICNFWCSHVPGSMLLDISNRRKEFLVRWLKQNTVLKTVTVISKEVKTA